MGYRKVKWWEQILYIFERFNRQRWERIFKESDDGKEKK